MKHEKKSLAYSTNFSTSSSFTFKCNDLSKGAILFTVSAFSTVCFIESFLPYGTLEIAFFFYFAAVCQYFLLGDVKCPLCFKPWQGLE